MLTPKQEKFVQNMIKGMSQREAYRNSYDAKNMKNDTIDNKASKLFKKDEIRTRYNELIKKADDEAIMTAKERMKWLSNVINGTQKEKYTFWKNDEEQEREKEADLNTKIKALDTLNKMDNTYQQNININGKLENPYNKLSEEELRKLAGDS